MEKIKLKLVDRSTMLDTIWLQARYMSGDGLSYGNQTSFKKGIIPWNKDKSGYSNSKKGYKMSDSIKAKISATLKGNSYKPTRRVKQINRETMEVIKEYDSIKQACLETGILQGSISNTLSGKSKTAGGFIWH